jgi:hypothetical protein
MIECIGNRQLAATATATSNSNSFSWRYWSQCKLGMAGAADVDN